MGSEMKPRCGGNETPKRLQYTENAVLVCGASSDLKSPIAVGFWAAKRGTTTLIVPGDETAP